MHNQQVSYKFKWANYDLSDHLKSRKAVASKLRRDAATLVARADQIEEELMELERALEKVSDK
ncbi:MAG: hypothetical protein P4L10_11120 [Acidobacteriaceae bacterium]|nr:hypothetical protein [Acidobacteriaceae bacterium]